MVNAQQNRIDVIGSSAPELAAFGRFNIGVTTIDVVSSNTVDVINTPRGGETAYYDRALTLEIWYPANLRGQEPGTVYEVITRNPDIRATLTGRAVRDAVQIRKPKEGIIFVNALDAHVRRRIRLRIPICNRMSYDERAFLCWLERCKIIKLRF